MFSVTKMSPRSEDYLLGLVHYYGLRRRRKKKGPGDEPSDDDSPDIDPDGDAPGFCSGDPYSIDLPGEPPGWWAGAGAAALGLSGMLREEPYRKVFRGFHPFTGKPLVQNAGMPNRRPGLECCLSALKDFSVLALGAPKEWREKLLQAFREVAEDVVKMIEKRFACSRAGKASEGCKYVPGGAVVGLWEHISSRTLDENVHIHMQWFNLVVDKDGNVRASEPRFIFQNQKIITAYGHAKLAAILKERFGLIVELDGSTLRIRGVPKDLVKAKSKRSQQIRAYMAEHGESGGKAASHAAKVTRPPKDTSKSRAELIEGWRADNAAAGFDDAYITNLLKNAPCQPSAKTDKLSQDPVADSQAAAESAVPATAQEPVAEDLDSPQQKFATYSPIVSDDSPDSKATTTSDCASSDLDDSPQKYGDDSPVASGYSPAHAPETSPVFLAPKVNPPVGKQARYSSAISKKLIKRVIEKATRRRNHFSQQELLFYTLHRLPEYGLDPSSIFDDVQNYLATDPNIVPLGVVDGWQRFTTKQILKDEKRMLAALDRMSKRSGRRVSDRILNRELAKRPTLSQEQIDFVRHLTQSESALRIGQGYAGVGKTHVLKTGSDACKRQGLRVHGVSPTGKSAEVLAAETGIECQTLTKFLADFRLPISVVLGHHARQLWRAARGRRTWRFRHPSPVKIRRRDIVLVDEAGMIGTRHMMLLVESVERGQGVLWLVGDPGQLPAVEGTPPLSTLATRYGAPVLKDIRRQRQPWQRKAARMFAEGNVGQALAMFAEHKQITVRDTLDETVRQACLEWTEEGLLTPHRALILANTNEVSQKANLLAQEHRLRAGCIRPSSSILITDEQDDNVYESRVYCGDRVVFTKNTPAPPRGYGVKNGSRGTVTGISFFTSEIAVRLDNGRYVKINVRKYPHIRLGYAVTTYKSQSASVPKTYAIVGGSLQNFPASYVQATRAIEQTQFYTTSDLLNPYLENAAFSPLTKQMSRKPDLRLATEFLRDAPLDLRPKKLHIPKVADQRPRKEPSMIIHKMPPSFWIVTAPTPDAELSHICGELTFRDFTLKVMLYLPPDEILGVYSDGQAARAHATKVLESVPDSEIAAERAAKNPGPLKCLGFPSRFWVVTMPSSPMQMDGLCFSCDLRELGHYILAGLCPEDIVGIYAEEQDAAAKASALRELAHQAQGVDRSGDSVSLPSRFWLVTVPTPRSGLADICIECDFTEFACRVRGGLYPHHIHSVYSQKEAAIAAATGLLNSMPLPAPVLEFGRFYPRIRHVGFPTEFWVVAMPTRDSRLSDICFGCNLERFALDVLGSLRPKHIVGIYANKNTAIATASELLQALHPRDAADAPGGGCL